MVGPSSLPTDENGCLAESQWLLVSRLERAVDLVQREAVGDEVGEIEAAGSEQAHAASQAAQDGRLFSEVGVDDREGHPVPEGEGKRPLAALVVTDDGDGAAHSGDV